VSESSVKVSVIIVVHNSLPILRESLKALGESQGSAGFEVICIDNASTDGSAAAVLERFPNTVVIHNDRNAGFAAACNQGVALAQGVLLLFLNPDVAVDPSAVVRLIDVSTSDPHAGLVSGRLRNPDHTFQATCRKLPTIGNLVFSRGSVLGRLLGGARESQSRYTLPDCTEVTEVPAVAATMVMIRKDVFDHAGGFDPRFFMFMEDTDLSMRVGRSGYHNLFVPDAGGVHHWGAGSATGRARRLWYHHLSVWKYFRKHRPGAVSTFGLPPLLGINLFLSLLAGGRKAGR
jgi:GT2 family glycosyltransferase